MNKRGVILIIVLVTVLIAAILANIIASFILINYRLTHHQSSRIQAYYAAQAGMNYALEQLRTGVWRYSPTNSCPDPNGCLLNDSDFPSPIKSFDGSTNRQVRIIFCPSGTTCASVSSPCNPPAGINFCVNATINYTYTP